MISSDHLQCLDKVDDIVRMYQEEMTSTAIAEKLGIRYQKIIKILRENGIKIRTHADYFSPDSKKREVRH